MNNNKDENIPDVPNPVQEESWDDFNRLLWKLVNEVDVSKIQVPDGDTKEVPNPPDNLRKKECLSFEKCSEIAEKNVALSDAEDLHLENCQYCKKRIQSLNEYFPTVENTASIQTQTNIIEPSNQSSLADFWQKVKSGFGVNWSPLRFAAAGLMIILAVGLLFFLFSSNLQKDKNNLANTEIKEVPSSNINIQLPETSENKQVITQQNPSNLNKITNNQSPKENLPNEINNNFSKELAYLPNDEFEAVQRFFNNGEFKKPKDVELLQETIIRRNKSQDIQPISPQNIATSESQPIIRWQVREKGEFKVEILDRELNKVAESNLLTENSWQIDKKLPADFYFWQVLVRKKDSNEFEASDKVFFQIVSQAKKARIEKAKNVTKSNLVSAFLYANAGLFNEAKRELTIELQKNPNSVKAKKLLAQINSWQKK